jgi:hypothetical protein
MNRKAEIGIHMINASKSIRYWMFGLVLFASGILPDYSEGAMFLIDRLQRAQVGDYIVTAIDNNYTVLIVKEKFDHQMSIEEISIPAARLLNPRFRWAGWRKWVESGSPGNTSWVMYTIHLPSGKMREYYSYTQNTWIDMATVDNFLTKLLTLRMVRVPSKDLKRVGPPPFAGAEDKRKYWYPTMTYEGEILYNVAFEAWRTRWPRDCSEVSGKTITIYVPEEDKRYPSYFPYWLEIKGMLGKAKIRMIDSGRELYSTRNPPQRAIPYPPRG